MPYCTVKHRYPAEGCACTTQSICRWFLDGRGPVSLITSGTNEGRNWS